MKNQRLRIQKVVCVFILSCIFTTFLKAQNPNFVLIITDDQGYADLYANLPDELKDDPAYDDIKLATPNMTKLAESGVLFTDAHTTANTCAPSRAAIMTGRYPQRSGFWDTSDSRLGLSIYETTLADVLKDGGYTNAAIGKWHLGSRYGCQPLQRGFDYFYGFLGHGGHSYYDLSATGNIIEVENMMLNYEVVDQGSDEYLTDHIADSTVKFIERNKNNPFFAYVCFNAVQSPWEGPKTGPFAVSPDASDREHYMGMLGRLDLGVKKIIDVLNDNGLTENTVIVLMSDNGGTSVADNTPLQGDKHSNWEGGNRVPFIVSMPGTLKSGEKFDELTMGFDIFPSFVSLAGLSIPDNGKVYDGVNLWPYLKKTDGSTEKSGAFHDMAFFDQNEKENFDWSTSIEDFTWNNTDSKIDIGIRKGENKLRVGSGNITLYDLGTDIGETIDILGENTSLFEEMKTAYNEWHSVMPPQLEAIQEKVGGCLDPRYEEYEEDLSKVTNHSDTKCKTLISKTGCRDHKASNFDYTVTNHQQSLCEYSSEPTTYTLTISGGSGGGSYTARKNISISADAAPSGQDFYKWVIDSGNASIEDVYDQTTTLNMPANDAKVTATYANNYKLTINRGTGDGLYVENEIVNIYADVAPQDSMFIKWLGDVSGVEDVNANNTTITMPAADATITASYMEIPPFAGVKVNFQPAGFSTPAGYVADEGAAYGNRENGFSYGWKGGSNTQTRERINGADTRYKTTNHIQKNSDKVWEIALADDIYNLFLVCGDGDNTDQINTMDVEGIVVVDTDGEDNFDEYIIKTVPVSDGKLTIKPATGADNAKICFVDISLAGETGDGNFDSVPQNFDLKQNCPNPFSTETDISFTLAKNGHAQLIIYNSNGQHIATLVNEQLTAGTYQKSFNAADLPSGVYYYKLPSRGVILSFSDSLNMAVPSSTSSNMAT